MPIEPVVTVAAGPGGDECAGIGGIEHCIETCEGGIKDRMEATLEQPLVFLRWKALAVVNDIDVATWYVFWRTMHAVWDGTYMCCIAEVGLLQCVVVLSIEVHYGVAGMRVGIDGPPGSE
jgi:hypothetical protein